MNTSVPRTSTLYIVGPPGAGKTTIGREVAARTRAAFHTIDDWVGSAYPPSARSTPMTDAQVDHAMSLLFDAVGRSAAISEFAYHDYIALLTDDRYPEFANSRKVIVFADLETCSARIGARRSPVRATYVERAWRSARDLISLYAAQSGGHTLVIDTTTMPIPTAVAMAACFFSEEEDT